MGEYMRFSEIQIKKIIDVSSGKSIGNIVDMVVNPEGRVEYFIIDCGKKLFTLNREEDTKIYWSQIEKIGEDVILINTTK